MSKLKHLLASFVIILALGLGAGQEARAVPAPPPPDGFSINMSGRAPTGATGSEVSLPMQIVLMFTGLTILPAVIMSLTPFLRITLVLHFLRQAIGTQTAPSNPVLIGLGLFLTILVMNPVLEEVHEKAWRPYESGQMSLAQAAEAGQVPLKGFLIRYVREKDVQTLLEISRTKPPARPQDLELKVLCAAYVLSELKTGFQIGAMLFLPFLVIDILVASVTLSVGIVQLPPVMVSAPFKIMLFVLIDGWNLVVGSLVKSFY